MSNTATAGEGTDVYVDGFDGIGLLKTCDLNFAQDTPDVTGFKKTFKVCIAGLYGCTISTSGFYDKFGASDVNKALYNHIIARTLGTLVVYPKADIIGNFGYGFTGFFTEYSPDAEVTKAVEFSANFNSNVGGDRGYVLHGQYDASGAPIVETGAGTAASIQTSSLGVGGTGYSVGDIVNIVRAPGIGATARILAAPGGVVTGGQGVGYALVSGGTGYTTGAATSTTAGAGGGGGGDNALTFTIATVGGGSTGTTPIGRGTNARGVRLISYASLLAMTPPTGLTTPFVNLYLTQDSVTPMTVNGGLGSDVTNGAFAAFTPALAPHAGTFKGLAQRIDTGKLTGIATAAANAHAQAGAYVVGDVLNVIQAGASGGLIQVLTLTGSAVATFKVINPGTGYSAATGLLTSYATGYYPTSGGTGFEIDITAVGPKDYLGLRWDTIGSGVVPTNFIFSVLTARKLA